MIAQERIAADIRQVIVDSGIPHHMREGVALWVLSGLYPGDFLSLILRNDFVHAAGQADYMNKECLFNYAKLLYNLPAGCWGSAEKMVDWSKAGGLSGIMKGEGESPHAFPA